MHALFFVPNLESGIHTPLFAQTVQEQVTAEYLEALQTANTFLWAWVSRNAEAGLGLLSDRLLREIKDKSWLRQFMVGLSNPHHQAFQFGGGLSEGSNRYVFSVILYEYYTGEPKGFAYPSTLEVVKQGHVWRVDRLPKSSDNP
jgi:hypothetical protein